MKKTKLLPNGIPENLPAEETQDSRDLGEYLSTPAAQVAMKKAEELHRQNPDLYICSAIFEGLVAEGEKMARSMSPEELQAYLSSTSQ